MRPYYADDFTTLWHGDALELAALWTCADVLLTDPPYGIGWASHGGGIGTTKTTIHGGIEGDATTAARDRALRAWGTTKPGAVFGSLSAPFPPRKQTLIYKKPPDSGLIGSVTGFRTDAEAIFLIGEWPKRPAYHSAIISSSAATSGGASGVIARSGGHPHAKPLDVLQVLIRALPPGVIADPFTGSGSTLVAAKMLGRRAIGIEIDEHYAELAARRLSQDVLPLWEL